MGRRTECGPSVTDAEGNLQSSREVFLRKPPRLWNQKWRDCRSLKSTPKHKRETVGAIFDDSHGASSPCPGDPPAVKSQGAVAFIVALLDDQAIVGLHREFGAESGKLQGGLNQNRSRLPENGAVGCAVHSVARRQDFEVQVNDERPIPCLLRNAIFG